MQSFRMVLWRQLDKAILNDVLERLDRGELTLTTASKELCVDRKRRLDLDAVSAPLPARFLLSRFQGREVELGAAEDREAEQLEITIHMQEVEEEVIDWVSCIIFKRSNTMFSFGRCLDASTKSRLDLRFLRKQKFSLASPVQSLRPDKLQSNFW